MTSNKENELFISQKALDKVSVRQSGRNGGFSLGSKGISFLEVD